MPEPQETSGAPKKKGVRVFGPDNRYYQFPEGTTKEGAVSFFKNKGITSPESPVFKPKAATPPVTGVKPPVGGTPPKAVPQKPTYGQKMDIEAQSEMEAISRFRPRWDTPEAILQDPTWYGRSFRYLGGELVGVGKAGATVAVGGAKIIHDIASALDPQESYERPLGEPQAQVGRDVVDVGKGIIDVGKATWDMIRHFPEASADPEKFGNNIVNVAMLVDGGIKLSKAVSEGMSKSPKANVKSVEAVTKAHEFTSGTPSRLLRRKAFEDAYVHAKGLDVAKKVTKAGKAIHEEVKAHAEGIAKQIDSRIPSGVVDAAGEAATILKEFNDVVKTPDKAHPVLVQMVRDAAATSPKLWSWEKARQFRSSVGRALNKVQGPQKVVLTRVYKDLTTKLGGAAKQYGLEKSWGHYNELSSKLERQFGDLIDDVHNAQSGQAVAQKLGRDLALTNELAKNLSKYGLKHSEVFDFVKTAKRVLKDKNVFNRTLFRLVYGSPAGAASMIMMRLAGAPWMAGLGAGALVGAASTYLIGLARVLRMSPDIIEHMMKERELPGRMKVDTGVFPEGEGETPEGTPQLPDGKPGMEGFQTGKGAAAARMAEEPPKQSVEASKAALLSDLRKAAEEGTVVEKVEAKRRLAEMGKTVNPPKFGTREEVLGIAAKKEHIEEDPSEHLRHPHDAEEEDTEVVPKKIPEGVHGKGKLAEQAKARERVRKPKKTKTGEPVPEGAERSAHKNVEEAHARARAQGFDVSELQIPEMEEFVRDKNPTAYRGLQKMRKAKGITDEMYSEALKYYILEHLEE